MIASLFNENSRGTRDTVVLALTGLRRPNHLPVERNSGLYREGTRYRAPLYLMASVSWLPLTSHFLQSFGCKPESRLSNPARCEIAGTRIRSGVTITPVA